MVMRTADTVFINGRVITLDDHKPEAEAVAVIDGKIAAVGAEEEMNKWVGPKTRQVNWDQQVVVPGFNDSHLHLYVYGQALTWVMLGGVQSIEEIKQKVKEKAKETPPGQVIMGRGWDQTLFAENRFLDRFDLDEAAPDHPVALSRVCGHVMVVNSQALALAEIDQTTPDPEGGKVDKDTQTGEPTGILKETAKLLFTKKAPKPTHGERKEMIKTAIEKAVSCGLTSVTTDDIRGNLIERIEECLAIYKEIWKEDGPVLRVNLLVYQDALDELLSLGLKTFDGDEKVRIGALKLVQDGSLGARTGHVKKPYQNEPENYGLPVHTHESLDQWVWKGHEAGMQVGIHVIGDAASDACLDAMEKAQDKKFRADARHRLIHFTLVDQKMLERTKKLGVGADIQPRFVSLNGRRVEEFLGPQRAKMTYAWRSMLEYGIEVAGGSDCPVDRIEPLLGIHNAVNRQVDSVPGMVFQPSEKLSVEDALKIYTLGSAYSTFEENIKGNIKTGKLADFTVLSEDPRAVPEEIDKIEVNMTVVGGKIVYNKDE